MNTLRNLHVKPSMKARTLLLTGAVLASAMASSQSVVFNQKVANVMLLQIDSVKKELKITDSQRAKMNEAAKPFNTYAQELEKTNKEPSQAQITKLTNLRDAMRTKVIALLTVDQVRRLREITLQDAGLFAIATNDVAKELGIVGANLTAIRNALKSGAERSQKIIQETELKVLKQFEKRNPQTESDKKKVGEEYKKKLIAEMQRIKPQVDKIEKDTTATVMSKLSTAQRQKWVALQGKPFKG